MRVAIPTESAPGERRVALVPENAGRLVKAGVEVVVQRGAGAQAGFPDALYEAAGATIASAEDVLSGDVVAKVQPPNEVEIEMLDPDTTLISLLRPGHDPTLLERLARRGVTALALEKVPRITRAQSMDVLSSQSTVAGYKAVLVGASSLGKFLPMLTTAAGNIVPAKVFVIGAGVAGLQAIATARRLGGVVSAFDVRPAAREQVLSLGAQFVASELATSGAEASGGYAKAQGEEERARTLTAIANHISGVDLVVTTAQIPGRAAPTLITREMLQTMRPGSVIVDVAAETGGNCEASKPGETVEIGGVTVMAPLNLPATVPYHASQMFGRNVLTLLQHLIKDGALNIDLADEITGAMTLVHQGAPVTA